VELSLRPATESDLDVLFSIHERAMRGYVEQSYGPWDDAQQRLGWRTGFEPETWQVVEVDGVAAGTFIVVEHPDHVFLQLIELDPAFQAQGIGTGLVWTVMAKAEAATVAARLTVLKVNPARGLYERLGFVTYATTETHYLMEWTA
jgi:ribosomal protein S18 acetylase RimI-like enzyme